MTAADNLLKKMCIAYAERIGGAKCAWPADQDAMRAALAILSKPENITEGAARELLRYDPILDRNPQPNQIQSARKAIAAALSSLLKE